MTNMKHLIKRVGAYTIDLFIILLISSLISSIPVLNKDIDNYQKTYEEYEEKYNDYSAYINLLEESYKDKEITEEEYNKLTESTIYREIIVSKYDDNKISTNEYKEIVKNINHKFDDIASEYVYLLNKKGVSNSIITLICTLLYFGILQYLLKGKTLGKALLKLQVVSTKDRKTNILEYLVRTLIVNEVFLKGVGIIFLMVSSKKVFQYADTIISTIISLIEAIIIYLVLTREDHRGLHDILVNTKVIETNVIEESTELNIEEKAIPKKETKSKSKSKKNKIIDIEYKEKNK